MSLTFHEKQWDLIFIPFSVPISFIGVSRPAASNESVTSREIPSIFFFNLPPFCVKLGWLSIYCRKHLCQVLFFSMEDVPMVFGKAPLARVDGQWGPDRFLLLGFVPIQCWRLSHPNPYLPQQCKKVSLDSPVWLKEVKNGTQERSCQAIMNFEIPSLGILWSLGGRESRCQN